MAEVLGSIQLIAALRPGPLGARRLARAVGRARPVVVTVLKDRMVVGDLEDRCERLEEMRHPTLGRCRAVIRYQGGLALVEDALDGVPLSFLIERAPVPTSVAVALTRRIFRALHIGWNRSGKEPASPGLVHGDLCPDHVWVEPGGRVKVLGLGTVPGVSRDSDPYRPDEAGWSPYCAPESFAESDGPAADVYSAGCLLGALLIGQDPGHASEDSGWHASVVRTMVSKLEDHGVEARLVELVRACMAFEPDQRPSATQVGATLEDIQGGLQGPRKEDWCREFLPPLIRISRGEHEPSEEDTPHFSSVSTAESVKSGQDEGAERTDPRRVRPPPLMTPAEVPSYEDIQVDPETGEVTWSPVSLDSGASSEPSAGGEAPAPTRQDSHSEDGSPPGIEMIPPHWTLEDEDDETDEVPFPFGRVEVPTLDGPVGPPIIEETTDPLSIPPVVMGEESHTDDISATEPTDFDPADGFFDPDAGNLDSEDWDDEPEWGAKKSPPWTLIGGALALSLLLVFAVMGGDDEGDASKASAVESASLSAEQTTSSSGSEIADDGEPEVTVSPEKELASEESEGSTVRPEPVVTDSPVASGRAEPSPTVSVRGSEETDQAGASPPKARPQAAAPVPWVEPVVEEADTSATDAPEDPIPSSRPAELEAAPDDSDRSVPSESPETEQALLLVKVDPGPVLTLVGSGLDSFRNGQRVSLEPGEYTLRAKFPDGLSDGTLYRIQLQPGQQVQLHCSAMGQRCVCAPRIACSD